MVARDTLFVVRVDARAARIRSRSSPECWSSRLRRGRACPEMLVQNGFGDPGAVGDLIHRSQSGSRTRRTPPARPRAAGPAVQSAAAALRGLGCQSASTLAVSLSSRPMTWGEVDRRDELYPRVISSAWHCHHLSSRVAVVPEEVERYARHVLIPDVGMEGPAPSQERAGAGRRSGRPGIAGVDVPRGRGVGTIGVADADVVEMSNCSGRCPRSRGRRAAEVRVRRADAGFGQPPGASRAGMTSGSTRPTPSRSSPATTWSWTAPTTSHQLPAQRRVRPAGQARRLGSIYRFDGQASIWWAQHGPCYRCVFPQPPPPGLVPSCAEGGVLGVLCAAIGSIQAAEVREAHCRYRGSVGRPVDGA
jgi:hypothetical protein